MNWNKCWCGSEDWKQSKVDAPGYKCCKQCGTWRLKEPSDEVLHQQDYYTYSGYWVQRMQQKGWLTLDQRVVGDMRDGRVTCWLRKVRQYFPPPNPERVAVEIGCGHGLLITILHREDKWEVVGVEPSEDTAAWIRARMGIGVAVGAWPGVDMSALKRCDLILAMDVVEHSQVPLQFMEEVHRRLDPGGIAIVQTPMHDGLNDPPFAHRNHDCFEGHEHLNIFTRKGFAQLCQQAGFEVLENDDSWQVMHELIVLQKRGR